MDVTKRPLESNLEHCERIAAQIDPLDLIKDLLGYIAEKDTSRPLWSHIGMATSHGSGVSAAIRERFFPEWSDY